MGVDEFVEELERIKGIGLYRELKTIEGPQGPRVRIGGREVILLCSNNYLGLASHPALKEAAKEAIERYGFGACASRLVSGTMKIHVELEERIADFKGHEASLLFNSGYHANLGLITTLAGRGDLILSDKLNHASIIDGCRLSGATFKRYPHRAMDFLEGLLKRYSGRGTTLIVTDGVFSMDGDIAPIGELLWLKERYGAILVIDDAHGTGVLGRSGRGTLEHLGIKDPSIIEVGTFGKAFGSFGAFVAGKREVIDLVRNRARTFIYTTALPPPVCAASLAAIEVVEREPERRQILLEKASFMRRALKERGLDTMGSETHIIPILVGDPRRCVEVSSRLLDEGIFIQSIRPPTVPLGTSRLRLTLTADHSMEEVEYALETLSSLLQETGHVP